MNLTSRLRLVALSTAFILAAGAAGAQTRLNVSYDPTPEHEENRLTSVFVTHDQDEALELADRVAVMNRGRIEQEGPPDVVVEAPGTPFVAAFLATGHVSGTVESLDAGDLRIGLGPGEAGQTGLNRGDRVYVKTRTMRVAAD